MEERAIHKADGVMRQRTESAATEVEDQAGPTPPVAEQNATGEQRVHSTPDKAEEDGKALAPLASRFRQ